jgi:Capsule polysaccharide biosynthesis protein
MWKAPRTCEAGKGRYAVLVCNWVSTSVPFFSMEIAFALRQEGCEVTIFWDSAPVGVAAPSEAETKIIGDTVRALPPWLEVVDVNGGDPTPMPAALGDTVDKIFRDNAIWFAKGEVPAAELLKKKNSERRDFLNHGAVVLRCLQSCGANRLIIPGGIFGLSGIYLACAEHLGLPFTTYDLGLASIMVSHEGCAAHNADFKIAFAKTKGVIDRNPQLAAYIQPAALDAFREREAGKDAIQTQKVAGNHETRYDCDVLVCLNYRADTAALNRERLFESVTHWLDCINKWSLENPGYRIYVRQHPAERFDWLPNEENYPKMIRNWDPESRRLRLIDAQSDVNTYDLLRSCKVVLPYTSTIGVEAGYQGKPVITSTKCYYAGMGFTWDPDSPEAYFDLLKKGVQGEISTPSPGSTELAALSYLILLNGTSLPTRFLPDDCRVWARESPRSLWNESAQRMLIDCLTRSSPLAYLQFVKIMRKTIVTKSILQRAIEWMQMKMPQKI